MRVALVFKRYGTDGGSERQLFALSRSLAEGGDDVQVFCASRRADPPPGVSVQRMPSLPLGHTVQLLAFSAWARRAVARSEARDGRFDIRHAFGRSVGQDVYRLGGGSHRTYLDHAHALDQPAWLRALARWTPYQRLKIRMEEQAIRAPTTRAIITNSGMVRNDLLARYDLDPGLIHVVRNGVDLQRFQPPAAGERDDVRAGIGCDPDDELALFLGTGYGRKGLEPTLRALALLAPRRDRLRLVVAGRETRPRFWQRLAEQLGVAARVTFLGPTDRPERLYRAADVYLIPTAYDPSANTTLEALASGLPVVTSAMDGTAETLEPEVHGSIVPTPVHPRDLARATERWLDHADRPGLTARLRARAEQHSSAASIAGIRQVYATLLDAGVQPAPRGASELVREAPGG